MIKLQARLFSDLGVGGLPAVQRALQNAIELEHSTIPVYLYALYSLDSSKNGTIASLIWSVAFEEMLHMTLASNVLNALGGSPDIDTPCFIPTYPGPLPGGVEAVLKVHLAPYSCDQLATFLVIEEPEKPLNFPVMHDLAAAQRPLTIGEYYAEIKRQMAKLPANSFSAVPRNQIDSSAISGAIVVTDLTTANCAIDTIVEQGEGTKQSPLEAATSQQFAHYYRYMEISVGKTLIKNPAATAQSPPDQQYVYGGMPITFDASGVYPVPTDPKAAKYAAGSTARHACDKFNYTYTSLLRTLHMLFNGQPNQIDSATGLMSSLEDLAVGMMSGADTNGENVGPSFEYCPNMPA